MRLLYVIDSLRAAGAEKSLAEVAPYLSQRGIDLQVAFLRDRTDVADTLNQGGAVLHPVGIDGTRIHQFGELKSLIRSLKPDLVHTTLYESDVLGRSAAFTTGTPVVTTFAGESYSRTHLRNGFVSTSKVRAAQSVDVVTCRMARAFHAVTPAVANAMSRRLFISKDKITVIPRGRSRVRLGEPGTSRRAAVRASLGTSEEVQLLLAVARHEREKGLDVLLRALADVTRRDAAVELLIAGPPGRQTDQLRALADALELGRSVRFIGPRDDVPDLICGADLVVVPSRTEGLPGVVLEAMALECPIVATDIPGVRAALGPLGAPHLVPADDHRAMADAITSQLLGQTDSDTTAARSRFERHFDVREVALAMSNWYAAVLQC